MPPSDDYADALGRPTVAQDRARQGECLQARGHGRAGLCCGLRSGAGIRAQAPGRDALRCLRTPYSLEQLFYVMNIHKGNPWRDRIIAEMARAVRESAIRRAASRPVWLPKGQCVRARAEPKAIRPGSSTSHHSSTTQEQPSASATRVRSVIFNAVDNWPIEAVAPTTQDATYIEVWPPYDDYGDLQTAHSRGKTAGSGKAGHTGGVPCAVARRATATHCLPAEQATVLASAAIWANGGFHLLLGEENGALCDPYYPKYATLKPDFALRDAPILRLRRAIRECVERPSIGNRARRPGSVCNPSP